MDLQGHQRKPTWAEINKALAKLAEDVLLPPQLFHTIFEEINFSFGSQDTFIGAINFWAKDWNGSQYCGNHVSPLQFISKVQDSLHQSHSNKIIRFAAKMPRLRIFSVVTDHLWDVLDQSLRPRIAVIMPLFELRGLDHLQIACNGAMYGPSPDYSAYFWDFDIHVINPLHASHMAALQNVMQRHCQNKVGGEDVSSWRLGHGFEMDESKIAAEIVDFQVVKGMREYLSKRNMKFLPDLVAEMA